MIALQSQGLSQQQYKPLFYPDCQFHFDLPPLCQFTRIFLEFSYNLGAYGKLCSPFSTKCQVNNNVNEFSRQIAISISTQCWPPPHRRTVMPNVKNRQQFVKLTGPTYACTSLRNF